MSVIESNSPFEGTPWNSDQEIYDFASHKRSQLGHDWDEVHSLLTAEGLNHDYAGAIIANLKEQETFAKQDKKKRKWMAAGLSILWAMIAVLFIRPISFMISPEYGQIIFIALVAIGLGIINAYRKGEIIG